MTASITHGTRAINARVITVGLSIRSILYCFCVYRIRPGSSTAVALRIIKWPMRRAYLFNLVENEWLVIHLLCGFLVMRMSGLT